MAAALALRTTLRSIPRSAITCTRSSAFNAPRSRSMKPISSRYFSTSRTAFAKKYTQDHEWIELSEDGETATIGISTYAANALGDVVYVELPEIDLEFGQGDTIGAVESVKSASDILAPISGIVLESNGVLEEKAGDINKSPEDQAWLAKIKVTDPAEVDGLMDGEAYKAFTEETTES